MVIKYETSNLVKERRKLDIEDTKNVFLKGTNPYDGLSSYFGIWTNEGYIVIVTIISWRNVNYKCYLNKNLSTENDIKEYLKYNKNVKIISKDEFKEQIDNIRKILKI